MENNKLTYDYNELMPDQTIDIIYDRIKDCIDNNENYNQFIDIIFKLNANKLLEKIKKLIK